MLSLVMITDEMRRFTGVLEAVQVYSVTCALITCSLSGRQDSISDKHDTYLVTMVTTRT